jgi:transglutaminase-like putative cysteine protease
VHWFVKIPYQVNRRTLLLSLVGVLWFLLILYPLGHAGLITGFSNFVYVLFAFYIVDSIGFRWYLSIIVKCLIISVFMHAFFYQNGSFIEGNWWSQFLGQILDDILAACSANWGMISNTTQSFGLLCGLWVGVRLYTYAMRKIFWLAFLMIVGECAFGAIASFLYIDTTQSTILYTIIGFALLLNRNYNRMRKWRHADHDSEENLVAASIPKSWFGWLSFLLVFVITLVVVAPKPAGVWADPFNTGPGEGDTDSGSGIGNGPGNGRLQLKSGYTEDTSTLGGSFVQDDTIAFYVITPDETYYRADSKSLYTGHGWLADDENKQQGTIVKTPFTFASEGTLNGFHDLKTKTIRQTYQIKSGTYSHFFTAYQVAQAIDLPHSTTWVGATIDYEHASISGKYLVPGDQYQVVSDEAYDAKEQLQKSQSVDQYPEDIASEYLQLPSTLPNRVKQLAQTITKSATGPYAKAQAISDYLKQNYTYATTGIPVPGRNQDFVDQFLFDTKKGYCDHFSSAMVVLARSIGIPARWVTGYAPGTLDSTYTGPDSRYIVRQKDAHAWAEVYINGYGWIPFEPTPGFLFPQPVDETQPVTAHAGDTSSTSVNTKTDKNTKLEEQQQHESDSVTTPQHAGVSIWWLYGALLVVLLISWRCRRTLRYQWFVFTCKTLGRKKDDLARLTRSAKYLIQIARKRGYIGKEQITFREFASKLNQLFDLEFEALQPLISVVEQSSYSSRRVDPADLEKAWSQWSQIARLLSK